MHADVKFQPLYTTELLGVISPHVPTYVPQEAENVSIRTLHCQVDHKCAISAYFIAEKEEMCCKHWWCVCFSVFVNSPGTVLYEWPSTSSV